MINIQLKNLRSISCLDTNSMTYTQHTLPNAVYTGEIKRDLLKMIIKLNISLLSPAASTVEISKNSMVQIIDKLLSSIVNLVDQKQEFFGVSVGSIVASMKKVIMQLATSDNMHDLYCMMKTYGDNAYDELFASIDEMAVEDVEKATDARLQEMVDKLIQFNSLVLPRYTSSMFLGIVTVFYIVFMKFAQDEETENLVFNVLFRHGQRILYDRSTDKLLLRYLGENYFGNKDKFFNEGEIDVRAFMKFVKGKKVFTDVYPRLAMRTKLSEKNMEPMYHNERGGGVANIYKNAKIDPSLDIFPYIFHIELPPVERMKIYCKIRADLCMKNIKEEGIRRALEELRSSYDEIFDHLIFPNRAKTMEINGTKKDGRYFNMNNFTDNAKLMAKLKKLLYDTLKDNSDIIRKNVC